MKNSIAKTVLFLF